MKHHLALSQAAAGAILFSTGGVFVKVVPWDAYSFCAVRGVLVALVFLLAGHRPAWPRSRWVIAGALFGALANFTFVVGNQLTFAANVAILQHTAPIYIAVLGGRLFGEYPTKADWLALVLAICGVTIVFSGEAGMGDLSGNIIALISGGGIAGLVLSLRGASRENPADVYFWGNILIALIALPFCETITMVPAHWLILLAAATIGLAFPMLLFSRAIRELRAIESILMGSLTPLFAGLWPFLALGETPSSRAIAGGAIVLVAVLMRSLRPPSQLRG